MTALRFRSIRRWIREDESGAALPIIATMLVVLIGLSAFAIDLGWLYLNSSRVQRAADSAALAGVIYLPGDTANVSNFTVSGANANGYDVGTVNGVPLGGGGPDDLTWVALADNRLNVTLESQIPTFFVKVLGFDSFDLTRTATAEYVKPVPLGAPANCMGIGPGVTSAGLPGGASDAMTECNNFVQNFWSAINGRQTAKEHGDPYGPTCDYSCSGGNPDHDQYYYFAVEVPAGANWVDVFLYDAGFYDRTPAFDETGDEQSLTNSSPGGTNMTFDLFEPDATVLIPEDNNTGAACSAGGNSLSITSETQSGTHENRWSLLCRITNVTEGIYVLRVGNGGAGIGGNNSYSILLDSSNLGSAVPRVYSLNEMSIFTNSPSGSATVYIAEVDPIHAGKTLELVFYDPGEGAGNAQMTVLPPPGTGAVSCSWTATDVWPGGGPNSGNTCTINSTVSGTAQYNGEWITMEIQIPDASNYTCDPAVDCFWKMDLDLNVSHDRTTWEARVIGNPVSLTPNP